MYYKKIKYIETESVTHQINKLKKTLIEGNVVLGKSFSFEIANIISQIQKLVNYYDSKKIPARFSANIKSLELTVSNIALDLENSSTLNEQIEILKNEFNTADSNQKRRHIIFKLLFFHVNILFVAYESQSQKIPNNSINEEYDLNKLTYKQRQKYVNLCADLESAEHSQRAKIQSSKWYYEKIMKK